MNVRCQPNCQSNSEKLKHIQNQILQKRYFLWQIFQVDQCHKMIIFNNRQQFDICDGHNSNHLAIECSSIHSLSTHDFNQCLFTGFNTKAFNIISIIITEEEEGRREERGCIMWKLFETRKAVTRLTIAGSNYVIIIWNKSVSNTCGRQNT